MSTHCIYLFVGKLVNKLVLGWHFEMQISLQSSHFDEKLSSNWVIEKVAAVPEMWHLAGGSTDGTLAFEVQIFASA